MIIRLQRYELLPYNPSFSPTFLFRELLVEFEEFGHALAFSHGFDGEAVGGHHGAVVVLVGSA